MIVFSEVDTATEPALVANILRKEIVAMSWEQYESALTAGQLPHDKMVQVNMFSTDFIGNEYRVNAYVLPKGLQWFPFLDTSKQKFAAAQNVIALRSSSVMDAEHFKNTLAHLRDGVPVVWIGHPGLGKSVEVAYIMMVLLQHLGEDGWPSTIAHRIEDTIFQYQLGGRRQGDLRCPGRQ